MNHAGTVTKDLKTALKNSNVIKVKVTKGSAEIECFKTIRKVKGFPDSSVSAKFNGFGGFLPDGFASAEFIEAMHTKTRGNWAALEKIIRPNDVLSFSCLDLTTDPLKKAEIFNEVLYATVYRKDKEIIADFKVDYCLTQKRMGRMMVCNPPEANKPPEKKATIKTKKKK